MKIAIIGAGISGLSSAKMLQEHSEVVIFEKKTAPGGLIHCERVNDCLFHKVGGHVFNSKNQKVLDWFWASFDRGSEFVQVKRNAKILLDGKTLGYPIENYLYALDRHVVEKVISEMVDLNRRPKLTPFEYEHFESFLKGNFGETLYQLYFGPYNRKIWQADLSQVPMEWLEGKLPMPNLSELVVSNIVRQEEEEMVHATFYYPKENGSQFIVDRLSEGLNIRTSSNAEISVRNGKYVVNEVEGFDHVIFTGDIRRMPSHFETILSESNIDIEYLKGLRSNGTSNMLCQTDANDISWLYIPEPSVRAHRIIYTGNFAESNNRGSNRKTCVVEFSGKVDYNDMVSELNMLPGNLKPITYNYEPSSYVIQDKRTRGEIANAKIALRNANIHLVGRFAEWEYYNMDKCIEAVFELTSALA